MVCCSPLLYREQRRAVWQAGKVVASPEAVAVWAVVSAVTAGTRPGP